jgi:hypothetical protein
VNDPAAPRREWSEAWLDLVAFGLGLGVAWWRQWQAADLIWSLWLSSLVVGYAMIVWSIFGPMVFIGSQAWLGRRELAGISVGASVLGGAAVVLGGLFLLAFFTFHFGMFHFVHSAFLQGFFPLREGEHVRGMPNLDTYREVLRRYWIFLPAAFVAERLAFRLSPAASEEPPDVSVTPAAIEARKKRHAQIGGMSGMMGPYRNVMRMHLLIFFFAAAHFARLENFLVYAVVYAVYFFPWRMVRREKSISAAAS